MRPQSLPILPLIAIIADILIVVVFCMDNILRKLDA